MSMADRIHARLGSIGAADGHLFHRHGRATLRAVVSDDNDYYGDSEALDIQRSLHSQLVWNAIAGTLTMIAYRMESASWGYHVGRDQGLAENRAQLTWNAIQAVLAVAFYRQTGARCRVCGHYETSLHRASERYAHCPSCDRAPHWMPVP